MFKRLLKRTEEYVQAKPKSRKAIGLALILIGLVALVTPFTPGSWLAIIGLELLGVRILFFNKFKFYIIFILILVLCLLIFFFAPTVLGTISYKRLGPASIAEDFKKIIKP